MYSIRLVDCIFYLTNFGFQQNQEEWTESNGYKEKEDLAAMDESCDFPTQKIWIITWLVMNVIAIIG